jgi:hypothetical protein
VGDLQRDHNEWDVLFVLDDFLQSMGVKENVELGGRRTVALTDCTTHDYDF